jgi:hypothetical protein
MAVTLGPRTLAPFVRFTLYNSPYPAHDRGCAVDLYTGAAVDAHPGGDSVAPSPVAGTVRDTLTVGAPDRDYAVADDHLILLDVEAPAPAAGLVARVLHVDPAVEPGDGVAVGDPLGRLVRSGYYAPWVPDHVHLGFRDPDANLRRATGSLPLELGVDVDPLRWDGTGEVVAAGDTYAELDAPAHPAPGERWVGHAATPAGGVLDGGLPHYEGGGVLGGADGPVSLASHRVGVADGRGGSWDDLTVLANGDPVRGISLFCGRASFGAKLVGDDVDLAVGDRVAVTVSAGTDG